MALPVTRADDAPDLELVPPKHTKRATTTRSAEVELAARAFTRSEQVGLYREGIESLREMAKSGGDTARASAAAKLASIFRDAALSRAGKMQVRILFVDPRELADDPEPNDLPVESGEPEQDDFVV